MRSLSHKGFEIPVSALDGRDLLCREPVRVDPSLIRREVAGKSVMVTGAGGSIGGELCRQLSRLPIAHLVVVERSEHLLVQLCQELKRECKSRQIGELGHFATSISADVRIRPDFVREGL